jgi:hypothetical protein
MWVFEAELDVFHCYGGLYVPTAWPVVMFLRHLQIRRVATNRMNEHSPTPGL